MSEGGFQFALIWALAGLALPLLALALPRARSVRVAAVRMPIFVELIGGESRAPRKRLRLLLAALTYALLVIAAARPQFVGDPISLPLTGRDLMMAVDISGSMETQDMILPGGPVTRLLAVQAVAGEFIERRAGDRLGLILFGRRAYLITPLTFDRETARTQLEEAEIGLAGKETAIGDAIGLAVKRLREQPVENRVLVLLTDGANTAGTVEPLKAAELAAAEGLRIYTIGVGADEMTVRSFFGVRRVNPSADLDEETLTRIANMTGGSYFRARDVEGLESIYTLLDELEPISQEEEVYRPVDELFMYPLGAAVVLGLLLALWQQLPPRIRSPGSRASAARQESPA